MMYLALVKFAEINPFLGNAYDEARQYMRGNIFPRVLFANFAGGDHQLTGFRMGRTQINRIG